MRDNISAINKKSGKRNRVKTSDIRSSE